MKNHEETTGRAPQRRGRPAATPGGLNQAYRIGVVDRAIDVLQAFRGRGAGLRLGEIAAASQLQPSTALRVLTTLAHRGLVTRHAESGEYSLGYELLSLAESARAQSGLVARALPALRRINDALDETVFLSIRSGDHRIDLEQIVGRQSLRNVIALGERKLLYVGAGSKVLLAGMDDHEVGAYLARTALVAQGERTVTDGAQLCSELRRIRRQGFAEGVREAASASATVAAPVRDHDGHVVGAISVIAPVSRYSPALRKRAIALVVEGAAAVSAQFAPQRAIA